MPGIMFATGIENSYPTIAGGQRVDEMDKCGHYAHWKEDLQLVHDMGIHFLRWGPAIYKTFTGPGQYDWDWTDGVMAEMQGLEIHPIIDLCHFGVPDWIGNFQNADFPHYFAEYASAFAKRYPHVKYWTPINEMLITTTFSAKYGWWNEMETTDEAYVRATLNVSRASTMAMKAITEHIADAVFIQSESSEYTHPSRPNLEDAAVFYNERRFLCLDLAYGHDVSAQMYRYLTQHGMTKDDYDYFMNEHERYRCILGTDYYTLNEHVLETDGTTLSAGEIFGYYVITRQYHERYRLPVMHTETNIAEHQGAVHWLWKEWSCMLQLRRDGIPIVGFTWYSLTDQMDWDTALREDARRVNPVGLYDLDRKLRKVGEHYRHLIGQWGEILPSGSKALMLV
ncbi:MAG: family 1 glycosylhydrolase [Chloroflexota bacterium]|nr:family 1 glycosylhydrolase [Chloroflexota bacterium]